MKSLAKKPMQTEQKYSNDLSADTSISTCANSLDNSKHWDIGLLSLFAKSPTKSIETNHTFVV